LLRYLYFYCPLHVATSVALSPVVHWSLHFWDIRLFLGCHRPPRSAAGQRVHSHGYHVPSAACVCVCGKILGIKLKPWSCSMLPLLFSLLFRTHLLSSLLS
jgi:hypothetical protein